jgi:glucosamine kinase
VSIFLGIDGGGSKTTCAIGDESFLLGTGTAGASNVVRVGEEGAREAIRTALQRACDMAGVAPAEIKRTCVGIAGGGRAETAAKIQSVMDELVSGKIQVVGDMVIALEAAFGGGPGVVVVAGTGSIAYGCNAACETARAGGWGHAISDEGSGHWIGRAAVTAALRTYDEGRNTVLLDRILHAWGVSEREQVVLAANATPLPDFAGLLPVVLDAADAGDRAAMAVLTQAGGELASLAKIVIAKLFGGEPAPVAMSGGVFRNSAAVRQVFYNTLRSEFPAIVVKQEIADPVNGALELARRGAQAARF